jgi:geranylgeranyl diphosphate synthase type II
MVAERFLDECAELVDGRLQELLPPVSQEPVDLHRAMRYSCLAPGKRLRPALCIASAEAVGGERIQVLDAACALEMVHCFSLIHDDLPAIDDDALRRGRPTCHVEFGEALAILAGDALFALAYQVLSQMQVPPDHDGRVLRCVQVLARAVGSDGLVGGEVMDVLSEGKPADEPTLAFIHSRKTGALIEASCTIGAMLGGGTEDEVATLGSYGSHMGLAFQIADDLLNELSTAEELGKAAGSDRARGKMTYPALFGIDAAREAASEQVELALQRLETISRSADLEGLARYAVDRGK